MVIALAWGRSSKDVFAVPVAAVVLEVEVVVVVEVVVDVVVVDVAVDAAVDVEADAYAAVDVAIGAAVDAVVVVVDAADDAAVDRPVAEAAHGKQTWLEAAKLMVAVAVAPSNWVACWMDRDAVAYQAVRKSRNGRVEVVVQIEMLAEDVLVDEEEQAGSVEDAGDVVAVEDT